MGPSQIGIIAIDATGVLAEVLSAHAEEYQYEFHIQNSIEKSPSVKADALIVHDPDGNQTVEALLSDSAKRIVLSTPKFYEAQFIHDFMKAYPNFLCIPSPFDDALISAVLRNLTHKLDQEDAEFEASEFPEELRAKYQKSVPEKILRINEQFTHLMSDFSTNTIEDLKREAHKIAGNSGAYGYPKVSRLCKAFELALNDLLKESINDQLKEAINKAYQPFFTEFKLNFQKIYPHEKVEEPVEQVKAMPAKPKASNHHGVVLVTHNIALRRQFELVCKEFYLDVLSSADYDTTYEQIGKGELTPLILIVDEYFHLEKSSGLDLIKHFKKKYQEEKIFSGMILIDDTLNNWILKKQQDVDFLFHRPVTDECIRAFLKSVLAKETPNQFRGLILDDDPEFTTLLKLYLQEIDVDTQVLNEETDLINHLEQFKPDILFLDLTLNTFDGTSILNSIRSNAKFNHLIIIILTASQDSENLKKALERGCDDFIQKPINPKIFQAKVQNILFRTSTIRNQGNSSFHTEFLDKNSFLLRCEHIAQYLTSTQEQLALIYIDFQNLSEIKKTYPSEQYDKVLYTLEQIFKSHFDKALLKGQFDSPIFAAMLKVPNGGEVQFLMDYFLQKIGNLKAIDAVDVSRIRPRAGAVLFHPQAFDVMAVDNATLKALGDSFQNESILTLERMADNSSNVQHNFKVIIVDDDIELVEILKEAYEKNGFEVITKHTGEDALAYFFGLNQLEDKCLILLDRILPDMDSLTVLKKVREKFPKNVKALILSSLSTEQDIMDGLKEGALDYITKPFSLPILMQKSKILLLK